EPPPYAAELETDHPRADHAEPFRHLGELERAGRIDDALAVELRDGQLDRRRPGREHDVRRFESALAVRAVDLDAVTRLEPRAAVNRRDAGPFEERLDARGELLHDRSLPLEHLADVERKRARLDAVRGELGLRAVIELRGLEQRFRRDAADVQARAAERTAAVRRDPRVDTSRPQPELRGANGRRITRRTAADDDDVELVFGHDAAFKLGESIAPDLRAAL